MKNISNHIGKWLLGAVLPVGAAGMLASCDDFLELKPLSEIVFDNYWEKKADVESTVNSCYSGMLEGDFLKRIFIWGDLRSDDIVYTKSGNDINIQQIIEENILETNPYLTWTSLYQVINRCNTVIKYAPVVAERDPNYTDSDLRSNIAEVTWIRSLCYFYLARTFRDVPYVTTPSESDDDIERDYCIAPTPFNQLLQQLVTDLEAVRYDALRYYPPRLSSDYRATNDYNTSRVTQTAFAALLADIYLWTGDYQSCLDNTKQVIDFKANLYHETKEEIPSYVADIKLVNDQYPLIQENNTGGTTVGHAYSTIFGEGNSFESVFELYCQGLSGQNPIVQTFFYDVDKSSVGLCTSYSDLTTSSFTDANPYFKYTDCRFCEYFPIPVPETSVRIRKYVNYSVSYTYPTQTGTAPTVSTAMLSSNNLNWIIYRLTDVMLMRAEALVELGGEANLAEAFQLVSAVYNRANNLSEGSAQCLKADKYSDQTAMRQLVRDERHRELMFEGKRWYDLVRYALREGRNDQLISVVLPKQQKNANRIRIQLQQPDALFWPYHDRELDVNSNLVQNSAYITNETSKK
ncbi:MAG: RagB/SusD family nutrient uptake outer membrane protein [Bacteroidales bacterium]|nr:RagB/SusD family nutrient uptake outer membrane protein [Bacteroidales bacterium]